MLNYAAALTVGVMLLWAGVAKLRSRAVFRERIADYRVMPYVATSPASYLVPGVEVSAGALLLLPATHLYGAAIAVGLLSIFTVVLIRVAQGGRDVICGCFGGNEELDTIGLPTIVRSGSLLVLAGVALGPFGRVNLDAFVLAAFLILVLQLVVEMTRLALYLVEELRSRDVSLAGEREGLS